MESAVDAVDTVLLVTGEGSKSDVSSSASSNVSSLINDSKDSNEFHKASGPILESRLNRPNSSSKSASVHIVMYAKRRVA